MRATLLVLALTATVDAQGRAVPVKRVFEVNKLEKLSVLTSAGARTVPKTTGSLTIKPGMLLIGHTGKKAVQTKKRLVLPYQFHFARPGSTERFQLEAVAEYEGAGMRFNLGKRVYVGSVLVGVRDKNNPRATENLPAQPVVQLVARPGSLSPAVLAIRHVNVPFERAVVTADSVRDKVFVEITPTFGEKIEPGLSIPVTPPRITLRATPGRLQGFGLATSTIVVQVDDVTDVEGASIMLSVDHGILEPLRVTLDASGTATARLRSSGLGSAVVELVDIDLGRATLPVDYQFPVAFVVAAILGGLIGGLAGHFRAQSKCLNRAVARGVLIGVVAAAAWAFGINLTGFDTGEHFSEGAVFVIAALGALFDVKRRDKKEETA
jgi:hypothetical protein